jgi:SAM-dependent methyltransferase
MTDHAEEIIDLYDRHAEVWNGERWRNLFERPWLDRFLSLLPREGSIVDIGCGSGEHIARYFIETRFRLTGVDSSATMIRFCKQRFPNETWVVADMRSLLLGRKFDGILAWDSFFHLPEDNQRKMFPIFRSHAVPKAALMITTGPRAGEAIGTYQGEPLYHASLAADEYQLLFDKHDFEVVSHVVEEPATGAVSHRAPRSVRARGRRLS